MSTVHTEHVLVVPTAFFRELGYFQGFQANADHYLERLLIGDHVSYRPRAEMEEDPSFKQLIPYVLFRYTDANGHINLFQYTRGTGQGEQRLHAKKSVGVGGHISSDDAQAAGSDVYRAGLERELNEEVTIDTSYRGQTVGLINDDLTEVGKVHLGVVHMFDVAQPHVSPREDAILDAGFRPVDEMLADPGGFETWSQICLKALFGD